MIVDSSALVAILKEEPEARALLQVLNDHVGELRMSAASYVETGIVFDRNHSPQLADRLDRLIREFEIEIVPVALEQARHARFAHRHFGSGNHPARLDFGDCFSYALARATGEPLLSRGTDFAATDIDTA